MLDLAEVSEMDDLDSIVAIFEDKRNDIIVQQIKLKAEKEIIDHLLEQIKALKETRANSAKRPAPAERPTVPRPKPVKKPVVEEPEDKVVEDDEDDMPEDESDEDIEVEDESEDEDDVEDESEEPMDESPQTVAAKMTERFKALPPKPPEKVAPRPAPKVEPPLITPAMEEGTKKKKLQLIKRKKDE